MLNSIIPQNAFSARSGRNNILATTLLAGLLSLGFAGNAFGQDNQEAPPPPPAQSDQQPGQGMGGHMGGGRQMPSVDDQIKHLTKRLKLTDDQQTKLKPILEDQRKQMGQIRDDASLSRQDKFSKMQELRQSSDTQIKSVLTEDQQKNFDKMRAEQQDRMKQWHKGGDNAPPAAGANPDNQ